MADNQVIDNPTNGNFTAVADEITSPYTGGTGKAQAVKLLSGTADSNAVIPGDATNGLDVDVTRVSGTVTVDSELTTADLDTGVGTDTRAVVGLVIAKSGGAANISNTDPLPISDAGGSVTVDGTVTANLAAGTNNIGDVDVLTVPAPLSTTGGGTEATALRVTLASDSTGLVSVDDNAGSLTIDSADLGVTTDAEATGNGSLIAILKRVRTLLNAGLPAALGSNGGVKVDVVGTTIPAVVTVEAAYTTAQTDAAIVTATGTDRIVVTRVSVTLDEATTVGVGFRIGLGATTTPTTTGVVASHPGMVPGGGLTIGDGSGVLGIGAAADDLRITSEVPTTGSLRVVVSYYLTT